jgi:hypothetical protein
MLTRSHLPDQVNLQTITSHAKQSKPKEHAKSMTTPPQRLQPPIIIRQWRHKPSNHRQSRHRPKTRISQTHRTVYKTQSDQVLGQFHSQHGNETHPAGGAQGAEPGEAIFAEAEEEGFEEDGG